ncbi:MAG: hypothetical protein ISR58_18030 [Anaerolineales bacterium]|nr:hypothetical protein [Anaerolineales bacterium]
MKPESIIISLVGLITVLTACSSRSISKRETNPSFSNHIDEDRMLLVLSAPSINEPYYAEVFDQIIEFDIAYANAVLGHDNIIILADEDTMPSLEDALPGDFLLHAGAADIWMRDFTTVIPAQMASPCSSLTM